MRESPLLRRDRCRRRLPIAAILLLAVLPARAQDSSAPNLSADERRCTGLWRATAEERVASCTTLIDSGRYPPVNLAILHDNRGMAFRANGDLTNARSDFDQAIGLNPSYTRAYANRGSLALAQRDFDGAIADLSAAIHLNGDAIPTSAVGRYQSELLARLHADHQDMLDTIRAKKALDDTLEAQLRAVLDAFATTFA